MKKVFTTLLLLLVTACASSNYYSSTLEQPFDSNTANANSGLASLTWKKPIVQLVKVPAMIRNGVYIPEHYEYVIIRPGEYILNTEPIRDKKIVAEDKVRQLYQIPQHIKVISPSGGDSVVVCFYEHEIPLRDETSKIINIKDKPFLLKNLKECYALYEKEPIDFQNFSYAFKFDNGKAIVYWSTDSNIITKELTSSDEAFVIKKIALVIKNLGGK